MDEDLLIPPISIEKAQKTIELRFPQIKVESIKYLGGGSHSAFRVNDEFLFRFPKVVEKVVSKEEITEMFLNEKSILDVIKIIVAPYSTPTQLFFSAKVSNDFDAPIAGYNLLKGRQLKYVLKGSSQDLEIARLLGDFLQKLHSITLDVMPFFNDKLPEIEDLKKGWYKNYQDIQGNLFPLLTAKEKEWTSQIYEAFLESADSQTPSVVLTHGDFGDENVLFDNESSQLGVIDFDDVGFGDSVGDFCLWLGEYGERFLQEMLNSYGISPDEHFIDRAWFYYNRIPFIYFDLGKKTNKQAFIDFGRELLENRMKSETH